MTSTSEYDSDLVASEVGAAIHALMWRRKISQAALGRAIGVGQSTVSSKLRGSTGISLSELLTIADLLGVAAGDLLPTRGEGGQLLAAPALRYTTTDSNREPAVMEPAPVADLAAARRRRTA